MIITLTMNPSVDRTATLGAELVRGGVNRIIAVDDCAGGKGINVARVVHGSGTDAIAVFPAPPSDPFVDMCATGGVAHHVVPVSHPVRVNLTMCEPDGTTTKINSPGVDGGERVRATVIDLLDELCTPGDWVVLAGSLPVGTPGDFYARLVPRLRARGVRVAVDTSDTPLLTLAAGLPGSAPDLMKPNGEELGQIVGMDGIELERSAADGDFTAIVAAARALCARGVGSVLVTLGGAGAILVDADGAWFAAAPEVTVRSTVGAGDSALAGYLVAETRGEDPRARLARAVAYGAAAASLPGTRLPTDLDIAGLSVTATRLQENAP